MFKGREADDHLCGECIDFPKKYGKARSSGIYDRALMKVIHALKYRGRIEFARPLGLLLFSTFISHWDPQRIDLILPVPLHIKRFRKRGFNQAFLLIRKWPVIAKKLGFMLSDIQINRDALAKNRNIGQQTGLDRTSRKKNVKNAFSLNNSALINEKRILLVDDVYTTGATVNECARILLLGGAKNVDVLTLAHTI
ncbi:MAG: ComF family protein [Desulfosarcina sp.]|nr:ComF family protein [Desulfobacterales bacterium]